MKSVKFLFLFVLMLSIASVNVDAQRRRSYSRSRSRTTTTQANRQAQPVEQFDVQKEINRIGDRAKSAMKNSGRVSSFWCNLICPGDDVRAIKQMSLNSQKNFYDTGYQMVINLVSSNGANEFYEIEWTFINQNLDVRRPSEFTVINNKVGRVWYTE
jgi:hypothetical protein